MSVQKPTVRDVSLSASPPFVEVEERVEHRSERLIEAFLFGVCAVGFGVFLPAYLMTVPGMAVSYAVVLPPAAMLCGVGFGLAFREWSLYDEAYTNGGEHL
jgi:hypothetical protein